jgi:hypothetical protein
MMKTLPKSDWRRKLHKGDEVTWNDPDDGLCSRTGQILAISYMDGDDAASITWMDGTTTEVLLRELA